MLNFNHIQSYLRLRDSLTYLLTFLSNRKTWREAGRRRHSDKEFHKEDTVSIISVNSESQWLIAAHALHPHAVFTPLSFCVFMDTRGFNFIIFGDGLVLVFFLWNIVQLYFLKPIKILSCEGKTTFQFKSKTGDHRESKYWCFFLIWKHFLHLYCLLCHFYSLFSLLPSVRNIVSTF